MPKTKTPPKARARTAPAAEAPQSNPNNAVPEPAAVALEGPGFRTPDVWSPRDRNPRPTGELTRKAMLVRGISWTISYSDGPLVFRHGERVAINESEFVNLVTAIDKIDFSDPGTGLRVQRSIRKFRMFDSATGNEIQMEPLPDVECGPGADTRGIFERAAAEKRFEGSEFTTR